MTPKRPSSSSSSSKKKKRLLFVMTLHKKVEVLDMLRTGMSNSAVGRHFGVNESTIRSIKKKENEIRHAVSISFHKTAKYASKSRDKNIVKMESALSLWLDDTRKKDVMPQRNIIREKARSLYNKIQGEGAESASTLKEPQAGTTPQLDFQASKGWLDRFLKRYQIRSIRLQGEAASADIEVAEKYPPTLHKTIEENGYHPQQMFNMDETGLYRKKMPSRPLIMCGNAARHMIKTFNIVECSFKELKKQTLNSCWKKLLPQFVNDYTVDPPYSPLPHSPLRKLVRLDKFVKRVNIRSVRLHGEVAFADTEAADKYPATLQKLIDEEGYKPEQIFDMDETGLYWKKMPSNTYIMKEELKAPGFKTQKDRVTLIICGNAAGHMIKPGFIFKSANPRALKNKYKHLLPVFWMSHPKAWITKTLTSTWFHQCFIPETRRYLQDLKMDYKVLLIIDNAGGRTVDLKEKGITVEFLPPNTTSLLQPMNQGVIRAFKALYTSNSLEHLVNAMEENEDFCMKTYWKSFSIASCLAIVYKTLQQFKEETVNACWKKLLPKLVHDHKGFSPEEIESAAVKKAVKLAKLVGGEGFTDMTSEEINELIDEHSETLNEDELIELIKSAREEEDEEQEEEDEEHEGLTLERLADVSRRVIAIEQELENYDSNMVRSLKFRNALDSAFLPYKELLKELKRNRSQLPMTMFFDPVEKPTQAPAEPDVEILMEEDEALEEEVDEPPPLEDE